MNSLRPVYLVSALLLALLIRDTGYAGPADSAGSSGAWDLSVAGYYYAFPGEEDLLMVTARANRGMLHLEARYNYEDRRTASAFGGVNVSLGETFTADLTPMAGVAFGNTRGVIPALEMYLAYGVFDFYAEGEYLFDLDDEAGNFAYTWLELGASPAELFRAGFVAQRTRLFETALEIDRGLFAQVKPGPGTVSLYGFNLFTDSWYLVIGIEVRW